MVDLFKGASISARSPGPGERRRRSGFSLEYVRVFTVTSTLIKKSDVKIEGATRITSKTKFAISLAAAEIAERTYVIPAQKLATEQSKMNLAKKTEVFKQKNALSSLSTASGLRVTEDMEAQAVKNQEADEKAADLKRKRGVDGKARKEATVKKERRRFAEGSENGGQ